MVRKTLTAGDLTAQQLASSLRCVPRFLAILNLRMSRPLDRHDLADIEQDTVVIILQKLDLFSGGAPHKSWIYRICSMEIKNGLRRKHRRMVLTLLLSDEQVGQQATRVEDGLATRELVRAAIEQLEPSEADVIRLKHFAELTFDEIAGRLHQPASTLKTRYYRAMSRLPRLIRQLESIA